MRLLLTFASVIALLGATFCCAPAKPAAKKYEMSGMVLNLDEQAHLVKIDAGQIGDWMGPMAMDYPVPNKSDWQKLEKGKKIAATVWVRGDDFWLADIKPAAQKP